MKWRKGPPGGLSPEGVINLYTRGGRGLRYIRAYSDRHFDVVEARIGADFSVVATLPTLEEAKAFAETYDALDPLPQ